MKTMSFHIVAYHLLIVLAKFEAILTPQKGQVRKLLFREAFPMEKGDLFVYQENLLLSLII